MGVVELKQRRLERLLKDLGSAVVAFSGGVDSSVLAALAYLVLKNRAVAVTLDSETMPRSELLAARRLARTVGIRHVVLRHDEFLDRKFVKNPRNRCYYCKRMLAKVLKKYALKSKLNFVLEGTNATELKGHRPGALALKQSGVLSPLASVGLSKDEVRQVAKKLKLPNFNKPSMACLSSRIPYGVEITRRDLSRVEGAESFLKKLGLSQVRVRCFGSIAVIETLPEEFHLVCGNSLKVRKRFMSLGFKRTALDLNGYRTGSMN